MKHEYYDATGTEVRVGDKLYSGDGKEYGTVKGLGSGRALIEKRGGEQQRLVAFLLKNFYISMRGGSRVGTSRFGRFSGR